MADNLPAPESRVESYLAKAAGEDVTIPDKPLSRTEQYLAAIAEGGGGGGGSYTAGTGIDITNHEISVDTDTIQEKLTAGTNITITDNVISAAGGSGPTVVQTTGNSTTSVMSQNAVTGMMFADPTATKKIKIGNSATVNSDDSIVIGANAQDTTNGASSAIGPYAKAWSVYGIAIGQNAQAGTTNSQANSRLGAVAIGSAAHAEAKNSIGIGYGALATAQGEMNIGEQYGTGYNDSAYRLLTGLYDPQSAHDAATKGYVDGKVLSGAGAPTTATEGAVGQLYEDTTNGKLYQCTAVSGSTYTWAEVGAGGGGSGETIKTLTSADNNWPTNNPTGIALWKLAPGIYRLGASGLDVWFCSGASYSAANSSVDGNWSQYLGMFVVRPRIYNGSPSDTDADIMAFSANPSSNYAYLQWRDITSSGTLSGSVLKAALEKEFVPLSGAGAPTTATSPSFLGEIYIDTTNEDAYVNVHKQSGNNVWKKITP